MPEPKFIQMLGEEREGVLYLMGPAYHRLKKMIMKYSQLSGDFYAHSLVLPMDVKVMIVSNPQTVYRV